MYIFKSKRLIFFKSPIPTSPRILTPVRDIVNLDRGLRKELDSVKENYKLKRRKHVEEMKEINQT